MKKNLITAGAVLFLAGAVFAQAPEGKDGPCKADAEKFCKDVKPGGGRIILCLKQHEAELSAECKAKGLELKKDLEDLQESCKGDAEKLCKGVEPGEGRLAKCLKQNQDKLSETCKATVTEKKEKLKKQSACAGDIDKLCKGVKEGEGRIIKCLKENEKDLSEGCKAERSEIKTRLQEMNPCLEDIEKLCKDTQPGEGRIVACLKKNEAKVSEACKAKGLELKKTAEELKAACQKDLDTLCKGVEPGEGRLAKCLKDNEAKVSDACKGKVEEEKEKRTKMKKAPGKPGAPKALKGKGAN